MGLVHPRFGMFTSASPLETFQPRMNKTACYLTQNDTIDKYYVITTVKTLAHLREK
jgi:hypothetical protein